MVNLTVANEAADPSPHQPSSEIPEKGSLPRGLAYRAQSSNRVSTGEWHPMKQPSSKGKAEALEAQLAQLEHLAREQLVEIWCELYGSNPPAKISDLLMRQAIAYRLQVRQLGGLNFSTRRALERALDEDGSLRATPRCNDKLIAVGAVLIRQWRGATHQVTVLENGMLYRGKHYRSLSEVARAITGTRWSGPLFFGLKRYHKAAQDGAT